MEDAIFINQKAARKFIDRIPYRIGRVVFMAPHYVSGALQGYKVIHNDIPVTENDVEAM